MMTDQELMKLALQARESAYAPHSGYAVGAALLGADGQVFLGCNVENSSYSATCCAERTAFCKAVSEGVTSFSAIAVAGGKKESAPDTFFMPCGICRQVMREFCEDDFVILVTDGTEIRRWTLKELLPDGFRL